MATMNISLPDSMKTFIDEQVSEHGYGTGSEYIRALVRRELAASRVRDMILEGAASPVATVADEAYFDGLRDRVRQRSRRAG